MQEKELIRLESMVLDRLAGRVFLLQDKEEKRKLVFEAFQEVAGKPHLPQEYDEAFIQQFLDRVLSYGIIDTFLADPSVEDIMINSLLPIYVHRSRHGLVKTDASFASREDLEVLVKKLVVFSGRKGVRKINNIELADIKGRVNIVYSPMGPQITITRAKENPLSMIELIESGTLCPEIAAQFWLYVEGMGVKPANLLISGEPSAGKTTLLNALLGFIPQNERVVIIEDTFELNTDLMETCSRLESDEEMRLEDLVKNALRMRPDRIIIGEVRGREAQDLMTAMNIGKYCMGTMHASTSRETIIRLTSEPMKVPETLVNLIDVFVIMRRYRINGKMHRVVGEFMEVSGMEQGKVLLSPMWRYDLPISRFIETAAGGVYRDRLAEVSGRSPKDVLDELRLRTKIINRLLERKIKSFSEVTAFMRKHRDNLPAALRELE